MSTKDIISSLRSLSTSIAHTDITKATLFQDAAAEIERLDKALYEEKEMTRQLMWEAGLWKAAYVHRDAPVSNIVPDKTTDTMLRDIPVCPFMGRRDKESAAFDIGADRCEPFPGLGSICHIRKMTESD